MRPQINFRLLAYIIRAFLAICSVCSPNSQPLMSRAHGSIPKDQGMQCNLSVFAITRRLWLPGSTLFLRQLVLLLDLLYHAANLYFEMSTHSSNTTSTLMATHTYVLILVVCLLRIPAAWMTTSVDIAKTQMAYGPVDFVCCSVQTDCA